MSVNIFNHIHPSDTVLQKTETKPVKENIGPLPDTLKVKKKEVSTVKKTDSVGVSKKSLTKINTQPLIRPSDTAKIQFVKPGFKLKKPLIDTLKTVAAQPIEDSIHYSFIPSYNTHLLQPVNKNPLPIEKESYDWIFYILLIILGAFTVIKVIHNKNLKQVKDAFFSNTITNQIVRDENILFQRASVFLTVLFYLVGAMFLYKVSIFYNWSHRFLPNGFGRFLIFVLLISLAYSLKIIILRFIGFIFLIEKAVTTYIFNVFLINNVLAILMIPVLVCIFFAPNEMQNISIKIGEILVGCAFMYRLVRGVSIGLSYSNFSVYYLFLYLCTLEIAPLLFIIKTLMQ